MHQQHRGAARAVVFPADESRRQFALALLRYAGIGQMGIIRCRAVTQHIKQGCCQCSFIGVGQGCVQRSGAAADFRPRRIEQMVAQAVYTRRHSGRGCTPVGTKHQRFQIAGQQAETAVLVMRGNNFPDEVLRCAIPGQKSADQIAARTGRCRSRLAVTIIGDRSETPRARDTHPRAAFFEIAPAINLRVVAPERGGGGRAMVMLVAIGGYDQRIAFMHPESQQDQAHGIIP